LNNKIVSRKKSSAIFLAIVLVIGTFALSFSSFMVGTAQAQPYYDGETYGEYNNYEPPPQYQSYQPDYKPVYSSYDKDKSYNTKDNDIIKKIKCNNNNININGENTGVIKLGEDGKGAVPEEGYLGASSSGSGNTGEGYNKKGFDCVTNTNDNNNMVQGGTGQSGSQGQQGPAGPQGIQGPTGPPGPQGPSTINTTNVYTVVGNTTAISGFSAFGSSIALCDAGDTALSGSFVANGAAIIRSDKPLVTENGWNATAQALVGGFNFASVTADVVCFDNPPLRP
jgi:hypothetical protein